MMTTQGRPAAPSLPPVDDEATVPFSELIAHGFDRDTVDATTQLADRGIFVTSSGCRYRFEKIPDPGPAEARAPGPAPATTTATVTAAAAAAAQSVCPQPPPPPAPVVYGRAAPPPSQSHAPHTHSACGRPPSHGSPGSFHPGSQPVRRPVPDAAPDASTHEVTTMMSRLSIHRFGAAPLYGLSDGGVQAAETLTDPDVCPRSPPSTHASPTTASPTISFAHQQPGHPAASPPAAYDQASPGTAPGHWTDVNYADYTAQANICLQRARQMAVAVTGLPSLLEGATPIVPPPRGGESDSFPTLPPASPACERELCCAQDNHNGCCSPPAYTLASSSASAPPSLAGPQHGSAPAGGAAIDTVTPVVVHPSADAPSTSSDGSSTGRDNVLPGEELVFDG